MRIDGSETEIRLEAGDRMIFWLDVTTLACERNGRRLRFGNDDKFLCGIPGEPINAGILAQLIAKTHGLMAKGVQDVSTSNLEVYQLVAE